MEKRRKGFLLQRQSCGDYIEEEYFFDDEKSAIEFKIHLAKKFVLEEFKRPDYFVVAPKYLVHHSDDEHGMVIIDFSTHKKSLFVEDALFSVHYDNLSFYVDNLTYDELIRLFNDEKEFIAQKFANSTTNFFIKKLE